MAGCALWEIAVWFLSVVFFLRETLLKTVYEKGGLSLFVTLMTALSSPAVHFPQVVQAALLFTLEVVVSAPQNHYKVQEQNEVSVT